MSGVFLLPLATRKARPALAAEEPGQELNG